MKNKSIRISVLSFLSVLSATAQTVSFAPGAWVEKTALTGYTTSIEQAISGGKITIYGTSSVLGSHLATSLTGSGLDFHFTNSSVSHDLYLLITPGPRMSFNLHDVNQNTGVSVCDVNGEDTMYGKTPSALTDWECVIPSVLPMSSVGTGNSFWITSDGTPYFLKISVAANSTGTNGFTLSDLVIGSGALAIGDTVIPEPSGYTVILACMSFGLVCGFKYKKKI